MRQNRDITPKVYLIYQVNIVILVLLKLIYETLQLPFDFIFHFHSELRRKRAASNAPNGIAGL